MLACVMYVYKLALLVALTAELPVPDSEKDAGPYPHSFSG